MQLLWIYDFIDAWHNIFLHQTEHFSHSVGSEANSQLCSNIGGISMAWTKKSVGSESFKKSVLFFFSVYKVKKEEANFPNLLLFVAKYKVP